MELKLKNYQKGLGFIGWILMIPVILIGIFLLGAVYTGITNLYWDKRVEEMCRNDGGITVYEKVILSKDQFDYISQNIGTERKKNTSGYYLRSRENILHYGLIGKLRVGREELFLIRSSDEKVLGKRISYIRSGGDLVVVDFPSSFGCSVLKDFDLNLTGSVFVVDGVK